VAARHVDVVERLFGLSSRCATGDAEALTEVGYAYHDDALVEDFLAHVSPGERGAAAVHEYFQAVAGAYEAWSCELDYVQDFGDRVLALGALRAVRPGEVEREHAVGWIFTFRGERIESVKAYPSYGDALRAATARATPAAP
jgi:hypothetical protein